MFGKEDLSIGLDIGTDAVKMVELLKRKGEIELINFASAHFPPEAISEGVIVDPLPIVDAIKKIIAGKNIKKREVKIGLSGRSVIVKRILMPLMSEEELHDSIRWEAEQHIPFVIDEVVLDFKILPDEINEKTRQMGVLLVAAKKESVKSYIDLLAQVGLKVDIVDLASFAIANSYEASSEMRDDEIICLLNVGGEVTSLNIMKKTAPFFVRDISIGGNHFSRAIQKGLNIDFNKADKIKIDAMNAGVKFKRKKELESDKDFQLIRGGGELKNDNKEQEAADGKSKENIEVKGDEEKVTLIINNVMEQLVSEIKRSFDYFRSIAEGKNINKMVISGGTARMKGLNEYFSEMFKIPVEMAKPLAKIKVDEKKIDRAQLNEAEPVLCVGIGLALR